MVKQIQFNVALTRPEVESLTIHYFQLHKYYRLQSKDGLRFRGYQEMQSILSPSRLTDSVKVDIAETRTGCRVDCTLNLINERTTSIDEEYFNAFLEHFKQALQHQQITMFSTEKYEQESRQYSKLYIWVIVVAGAIGFVISLLLKIDFLFIAFVVSVPALGVWAVNRKRKQKEKVG